MKISKIILYNEPTVPEIQLEQLTKFITEMFPVEIEIRNNFFTNSNNSIFEKIASSKIFDLKKPYEKHIPSNKETISEQEEKDITQEDQITLYDGFEMQKIITEYISNEEDKTSVLHIVFTNKTTCTFDENDLRYHARALISSNPAIISTTGMIEAPAKPKEYYLDLMTASSKEQIGNIKEKYKGDFLGYHDIRISEITIGYTLQAIMYYETGEAFCEDKNCRLYNAHWQKDLFNSQLKNKKFCKKHEEIIEKLT